MRIRPTSVFRREDTRSIARRFPIRGNSGPARIFTSSMPEVSKEQVARAIDHTNQNPEKCSDGAVTDLCVQAGAYGFRGVCVPLSCVPLARRVLQNRNLGSLALSCGVDFPIPNLPTALRVKQSVAAIEAGATEIEIPMDLRLAKMGQWDLVTQDIREISAAVRDANAKALVKVVVETDLWPQSDQILRTADAVRDGGAHVWRTSTGFFKDTKGAQIEQVRLVAEHLAGSGVIVKASVGIRTQAQAQAFLSIPGVGILGTFSGVEIIQGWA